MIWHDDLYAGKGSVSYPVFDYIDVYWLKRCADNAERWASSRMSDPDDHMAHTHVRELAHVLERHLL